ncbi:MAG TPA: DUF2760 domain-containing protein [Myxococcales bacterium]|nr:DUF2760 domain-containing protein [Myxococcales bacterium]
MNEQISPMQRFLLAFVAFFAVLFNRQFALGVHQVREAQKKGELPPAPEKAALPATVVTPAAAEEPAARKHRDALHVLAILQRDGRFIDFLQEDIANFSDGEVGAAARAVHEGCRKAVHSYFSFAPVLSDPEGANVVVDSGFDASRVSLTGNVVGNPPFRGTLRHHGWQVKEIKLPTTPDGQDPAVVAPAEVELP